MKLSVIESITLISPSALIESPTTKSVVNVVNKPVTLIPDKVTVPAIAVSVVEL